MREIVGSMRLTNMEMFYLSENFGIGVGMNKLFRSIMQTDVPILIEDSRIGLLKKGELNVTVNLINYDLRAGCAAYIGRGSIVQVNSVTDDLDMKGMVLGDDFMSLALHGRMPSSFSGRELGFYLTVSEHETAVIDRLIQTAWDVAHQKGHNPETIYGIVSALAYYYDSLKRNTESLPVGESPREREIFERFIALVNADSGRERSISYYADRMFLSPRYLGTVVRQASGCTAKEWIDRSVITNAKVMLRHSSLQVAEISDRLNFANNSFFCKYFRRLTGMSPLDYRNLL